jgi:hypothetical protein
MGTELFLTQCCTEDEGMHEGIAVGEGPFACGSEHTFSAVFECIWSLEAGLQEQASNRLKLLWTKAMVVSVEQKAHKMRQV